MWGRGMVCGLWTWVQQRLPTESTGLEPNDEMIQLVICLQFNTFIRRESRLAMLIEEVVEPLLGRLGNSRQKRVLLSGYTDPSVSHAEVCLTA
jgi:hypothetical protein